MSERAEDRPDQISEGSFEKYLRHSGDFVRTLALAIQRADVVNRARLERAFPQMVAAIREDSWYDAPPGFEPHYQADEPRHEQVLWLPKATPVGAGPVPGFSIMTGGTVPDFPSPEQSLGYYRSHADDLVRTIKQSLPGGLMHALLEALLREYCLCLGIPLVRPSEEVAP